MGVCSSTKKRIVVRQSSSLKFPLQQQFSQQKKQNGTKFVKKESDLNLVPAEMQKNWKIVSDESIFEREKRMAVILVSCQPEKASQLVLVDVDFQSVSFGKVICRLSLPLPGEELFSLGCMRNTHSGIHQEELDHLLEKQQMNQQFTLIAPVPSHSRIYVFNLMDGTIGNDNTSLSGQKGAATDGALLTQIRIQKCINREELSRWDLGAPLSVCSNNAGRSSAIPLLIVTNVDRGGHSKGDLLRLDRRTFCPVDRRKRSITEEDRESSVQSGMTTFSNSPTKSQCAVSTPPGQPPKFPFFGGALAINVRNGVVFSTEWGNLEQIFKEKPNLKQNLGSQDLLDNGGPSTTYGCSLNVWDIRKRRLIQTIRLDPEEGLWPICIRMVHNPELSHGFLCTALGGCIFHVHKSTKSGTWLADRVAKFSSINVPKADWAGSSTEIPAFLVDMAISMDDNNLFVSANFHGFVAQMDISDPFRPSLIQKVFLGGIVYKCMGFTGLGKMPKANTMSISYNTEEIKLDGRTFEGGPCRLQLSLDGRRLFISNSLLRNWDQHFFPQLTEYGSSIALVHVDPTGMKPMRIDEDFGIHFDDENAEGRIAAENQKKTAEFKSPFYAREMRFLGGDSTADFI